MRRSSHTFQSGNTRVSQSSFRAYIRKSPCTWEHFLLIVGCSVFFRAEVDLVTEAWRCIGRSCWEKPQTSWVTRWAQFMSLNWHLLTQIWCLLAGVSLEWSESPFPVHKQTLELLCPHWQIRDFYKVCWWFLSMTSTKSTQTIDIAFK